MTDSGIVHVVFAGLVFAIVTGIGAWLHISSDVSYILALVSFISALIIPQISAQNPIIGGKKVHTLSSLKAQTTSPI